MIEEAPKLAKKDERPTIPDHDRFGMQSNFDPDGSRPEGSGAEFKPTGPATAHHVGKVVILGIGLIVMLIFMGDFLKDCSNGCLTCQTLECTVECQKRNGR